MAVDINGDQSARQKEYPTGSISLADDGLVSEVRTLVGALQQGSDVIFRKVLKEDACWEHKGAPLPLVPIMRRTLLFCTEVYCARECSLLRPLNRLRRCLVQFSVTT